MTASNSNSNSNFLQSAISKDGSLAAIVVPSSSASSTRVLVQIHQVTASSCGLQLTLQHTTSNQLQELVFAGKKNSTVIARFGTTEVVVWDLNRGVVVHKLLADDDQSFLGLATDMGEAEAEASSYYLLTRHDQKLYVHEYSTASKNNNNHKLVRKIKSGRWEGEDESTAASLSLCVSATHVVVQTAAGMIRVMDAASGKKVGKIKSSSSKGGSSSSTTNMVLEGTALLLQTAGAVVLYNVDTCQAIHRVPHEVSSTVLQVQVSSSSSYTLLVDNTVYSVDGSSHETLTQLTTSRHPAALFLTKNNKVLALIHQKTAGCRAQWVDLGDDDLALKVNLEDEVPTSTTTETKEKTKRKSTDAIMLGPGQAGMETAPPAKKSKATTTEDSEKDDEEEADPKDLSIAERLQQLTNALDDDEDDDDETAATTNDSFKAKQATTESLKELLSQALQSGDDSLLELALGVRDVKIISTTLKEIEPTLVVVLLSKLTTRLASNPLRAEALAMWLSHCLKVGRFQPHHLAALRNLLYERIESFSDLLRLEGRLSMMCDVE
jgi:hypothetical protein